jgi:hypothetical protein
VDSYKTAARHSVRSRAIAHPNRGNKMRFHLLMLLLVILVSLGMHGLASATPTGVTLLDPAPGPVPASWHAFGPRP